VNGALVGGGAALRRDVPAAGAGGGRAALPLPRCMLGGELRAWSHCRCVLPLIHVIPD
jgi:hypothetical protein